MNINQNQIFRVLRRFSILLLIFMSLFTILLTQFYYRLTKERTYDNMTFVNKNLVRIINEQETSLQREAFSLVENNDDLNALINYFELSYSENLEESLMGKDSYKEFNFLPYKIYNLYEKIPDLKSVGISLNDYDYIYYSNENGNKYGKKMNFLKNDDEIILVTDINKPFSSETIGFMTMTFSQDVYNEILDVGTDEFDLSAFVLDGTRLSPVINNNSKKSNSNITVDMIKSKPSGYLVSELDADNGDKLFVTVPKSTVLFNTIKQLAVFFLIVFGAMLILRFILYRMFKKYMYQLKDILVSSKKIIDGEYGNKISTHDKTDEMKQIADTINQLLDSSQSYIKNIYDLEIKHKDAQMSTLLAQINPHFFYNTLEYIRMSALTEGAEELAEVIFAFSSLLRNNSTNEKYVTVSEELSFCEKYIYLFKSRYPNQVDYRFEISEKADSIRIPKFTLQPIIENYFVHGIDFTRTDNMIRIKVTDLKTSYIIEVIDNGIGISTEKIDEINEAIRAGKEPSKDSVGIYNVAQRLNLMYGDNIEFYYSHSSDNRGVTVTIRIREEAGNHA